MCISTCTTIFKNVSLELNKDNAEYIFFSRYTTNIFTRNGVEPKEYGNRLYLVENAKCNIKTVSLE